MARAAETWRYVVPPAGALHDHPPLRALVLSDRKPDDLKEKAHYRGRHRHYAQIRYGSPNSVRITVVLDEVGGKEMDLYVDAGRKRLIEATDLVKAKDGVWRVSLDADQVKSTSTRPLNRTVIFRYGRASRTLSYATCGYLEGHAKLGDHLVAVRRMDGDGNGFFSDAQDRLWIDLNKDGRWDPLQEQFLFAPILRIGTTRYVVRSDAVGTRLAFEKVEGTGKVKLVVRPALAERIEDLTATLQSRDGCVFSLHVGKEADLPVAEYRVSVVTVCLKDADDGPCWNYVFTDNGGREPYTWHQLNRGGTLAIDPIGKLELLTGIADGNSSCTPGEQLLVRPELYTGDGLLINTAYRGKEQNRFGHDCAASISLVSADGGTVDAGSSGFA